MFAKTERVVASVWLVIAVFATVLSAGSADVSLRTADLAPELFEGLKWRAIGPAVMGGRVTDLATVESNPSVFYAATATGNLWLTRNHGTTWEPLFEDQAVSSIGDVTLAPSNPNVVWVGTGESNNRQSSPWGQGVYKSVDGGRNWKLMGLEETRHVGRILIHPTDPDTVYVAATGHLWGPNSERGVFRTTDGGATWQHVLFTDEDTGATDLALHPSDPDTILAALYQRRRTAWGFNGGGPGSGIYRSSDGGDNWTRVEKGLPTVSLGRIALDFYRGDPNLVYATVEADADGQGVYRSTDGGSSWEKLSSTNPRPMYFSQIRVDPKDEKRIYVLGVQLHVSDDGGRTFTSMARSVHSDHHAMWIDPANPRHLIMGGDGGLSISMDRAATWRSLANLPIGQFYEIGLDMQDPYYVCGGLQDNGSWCGPSATMDRRGIRNADWFNVMGGDGFYTLIDPDDPNVLFGESQNGNLGRIDRVTGEIQSIRPTPRPDSPGRNQLPSSRPQRFGSAGPSYRFNWNAPVVISSHDRQTIYYGGNVLLRSDDRGLSWREISPDLTRQKDRNKLEIMGTAGDKIERSRNDGVSYYGTLTTISESPLNASTLYVGSDDGNVQMTRDGGENWVELEIPGVPDGTYVSRVVASSAAESRAYVTFDGHYHDDYQAHVFTTEDYGESWRSISQGLPATSVNVIAEHFRNPDLLFVGNEMGVFFSVDRGQSWSRLKNNLPTVPVDDIRIHPRENDLVIGTHGRSIWIMDDITPLENLSAAAANQVHLFAPRPETLINPRSPQGWVGDGEFAASNPAAGGVLSYFVSPELAAKAEASKKEDESRRERRATRSRRGQPGSGAAGPPQRMRQRRSERRGEPPAAKALIRIRDGSGEIVRHLEGPIKAGIRSVTWDLRIDPPYRPEPGEPPPTGRGRRFGGAPQGPRVLPGRYSVELEIDGEVSSGSIDIASDSRIQIAPADLEARQGLLMKLYRISKPAYQAGRALQRLQQQLGSVKSLLEGRENAPKSLAESIAEIEKELQGIQRGPAGQAQLGRRLGSALERSTSRPTVDQERQVGEAVQGTIETVERVNRLITQSFPALYQKLNQEGIRPDPGNPIEIPTIEE